MNILGKVNVDESGIDIVRKTMYVERIEKCFRLYLILDGHFEIGKENRMFTKKIFIGEVEDINIAIEMYKSSMMDKLYIDKSATD